MGKARLNGLALMYIHRDIECDVDNVVYKFERRNLRWMKLYAIPSSESSNTYGVLIKLFGYFCFLLSKNK